MLTRVNGIADKGIKVTYLHSDIDTIERMEIIRDLRMGKYDVLVGINLLREGLDLPEVSLIAILDADKKSFSDSRGGRKVGEKRRTPPVFVFFGYNEMVTDLFLRRIMGIR